MAEHGSRIRLVPRETSSSADRGPRYEAIEIQALSGYPEGIVHIDTIAGGGRYNEDLYKRLYEKGETVVVELVPVEEGGS